jgi:Septum formation
MFLSIVGLVSKQRSIWNQMTTHAVQIRLPRSRFPRLLNAGACVVLVGALLAGCSRGKKGTPVLELATLGPGTCLNVPNALGEEVTSLPKVDCATVHTHEIYSVVKFVDQTGAASDVFPGLQKLDAFATQVCVRDFEPFVGTSNFDSTLLFTFLTPTLTSWNDHKDREVLCVLQGKDFAPLTGSMRNSHR